MPSLITALHATLLTAAHRQGHEKHHQHYRYGNHDYNDSRCYGCDGDQEGVAHSVPCKGAFRSEGYPTRRAVNVCDDQETRP